MKNFNDGEFLNKKKIGEKKIGVELWKRYMQIGVELYMQIGVELGKHYAVIVDHCK
jgi:hypothetical protein